MKKFILILQWLIKVEKTYKYVDNKYNQNIVENLLNFGSDEVRN